MLIEFPVVKYAHVDCYPMASSSQLSTRLKIFPSGGSDGIHVILIPGVGTANCESWGICEPTWAEQLASLNIAIEIHSYDHQVNLDNDFSWQGILDAGRGLLMALQKFQDRQTNPTPLVFICHGLGGSILKQALCIANTHYDRYCVLIKTITGIIFLGTPHSLEGADAQEFSSRALSMLKIGPGNPLCRQSLMRIQKGSLLLRDLANRFQSANYRVKMISVFEKETTRIREPWYLFSGQKDIVVVDEALCAIASQSEEVVGVDLNHLQLPQMNDSAGLIHQWFQSIVSPSLRIVEERLHSLGINLSIPILSSNNYLPFSVTKEQPTKDNFLSQSYGSDSANETSVDITFNSDSSRDYIDALIEGFMLERTNPEIPCFMVETFTRNSQFYGRQDMLERLDEVLLPSKDLLVSSEPDRARIGLLCGMAGLGKTETAVEYAYSRREEFDAVFWIRSEDTSKLDSDLAHIALSLGIQDHREPNDKAINKGLALEWLYSPYKIEHEESGSKSTPASWLLVFDNADDPDILAPYKDIANNGAVLITSRNPLAVTSFSQATSVVDIQPFNVEESAEFIQQLTQRRDDLEQAKRIGDRLGGLPLAITQMAGYIRLSFLSFERFLDLYDDQDEGSEIHGVEPHPRRETARGNMLTVWSLEKLSPEAIALLEIMAFLDADGIQEPVLLGHCSTLDNVEYPKKKVPFYNARKQLIASSLVRHDMANEKFWIHRVTQDVIRAGIPKTRQIKVFSNAVSLILSAWPVNNVGGHAVSFWEVSESLYPHVVSLKAAYEKYFAPNQEDGHVPFARLLTMAGWYQHERGQSHHIKPPLHLALEICQRNTERDLRDLESDIRYVLGAVANETNDTESCLVHNAKFLEIRQAVFNETGATDERLARAYNQLGTAWMMAKDYKKAEKLFAASEARYKAVPGFTKGQLSIPLANIGLAYWLQGKLDHAASILERGLADREELYGYMDNHSFRTGRLLHALGNVRLSQGRTSEGERLHLRALEQYQSTICNQHHRTADVCHKVAQNCFRDGNHAQAIALIDQALKAWSVDTTVYAPEITRTTFLKGKVLLRQNKDEAEQLIKIATRMRSEIIPSAMVKEDGGLTEEDFDEIVTFWSR
ncbi:hypothetical protein GGS23DRAFT_591200 [Durotheca rogersii]|uniref:uncharacterized protein n=1 Tax=Durotheca rogersii TaxID=419775 RepID=UPI00221FC140|nr:uncharacterized protein GGS23DRAFT_591200 [Durotheca rogersii]KAI5853292.1 hypothetical protein GGS23DRAFT_591200 [Durotheca rogersii]